MIKLLRAASSHARRISKLVMSGRPASSEVRSQIPHTLSTALMFTPPAYMCALTAGGDMQGVGGRLRRRIIRGAGVAVSEMIMKAPVLSLTHIDFPEEARGEKGGSRQPRPLNPCLYSQRIVAEWLSFFFPLPLQGTHAGGRTEKCTQRRHTHTQRRRTQNRGAGVDGSF